MKFIQSLSTKDNLTENGAITSSSTGSELLDLFSIGGASRNLSEEDILSVFLLSYNTNELYTLRLLFHIRDVRSGLGERRIFRICLKWLALNHINTFDKIFNMVDTYGRWDDLFEIIIDERLNPTTQNKLFEYIIVHLVIQPNGLLCKWFPRSGKLFNMTFRYLKWKPKELRKHLVANTNVVETKLCNKTYSLIEYRTVPSIAFKNYSKFFKKYDEERFIKFLGDVSEGKQTINASSIFPHDIVSAVLKNNDNATALNLQWTSLPDYMENSKDIRLLPVCDVSGSMLGLPLLVCISLGIYISERNRNESFKDSFITFSNSPRLVKTSGSLRDRVYELKSSDWGYNTNLISTFELILNQGIKNNISNEEMPTHIIIFSDMEFDEASGVNTNFEEIIEKYKKSEYTVPSIIFWNLNSRSIDNKPVTINNVNTFLVSGFSPSLMKFILNGDVINNPEKLTPLTLLMEILDNERYQKIVI